MNPSLALLPGALLLALAANCGAQSHTQTGDARLRLEGLLQVDGYRYGGDLGGSDAGMRRAELIVSGAAARNARWKVGYDLHARRWLDVKLALDHGRHTLTLGQFKQPIGLEELTSSHRIDFIARAAAIGALAVGRRAGVGYAYDAGRWQLGASAFGRGLGANAAQGTGAALRAVWVPDLGAHRRLHLALAHARHAPDGGALRLGARPVADLAGRRLLDSGRFGDVRQMRISGAEGAYAQGALKLQAEALQATVSRRGGARFHADGGYLSAVWNLDGSRWDYRDGQLHADSARWQLGARLEHLDLDSAGVEGGRMSAFTLGVNWRWREHLRLALNASRVESRRRGADFAPNVLGLRAQVDW